MNSLENIASQDIHRAETALKKALRLVRIAHGSVMRCGEEDGPGRPSLGFMEISVRAVSQANDAARYARHAVTLKGVA